MSKVMIVLVLIILSFSFTGELYRVYADREFGFWAIRSNDTSHRLNYTDRTLNINTGDTVGWVNEDTNGDRITLLSEDVLWEGGKSLGYEGNFFDFTFNSSGKYRFSMSESRRFIANNTEQNTSVYDEDTDTWINTTTTTPYTITNFPPRYQTIVVTGPTIGNGTYPITKKTTISISTNNGVPNGTKENNVTSLQQNGVKTIEAVMVIKPATAPTVTSKAIVVPSSGVIGTSGPALSITSKPIESYQEFTLYEIIKRWYTIIEG